MTDKELFLLVSFPPMPWETEVKPSRKILLQRCPVCKGHGRLHDLITDGKDHADVDVSCPVCCSPQNKYGVPGWIGDVDYRGEKMLREQGYNVYSVKKRTS